MIKKIMAGSAILAIGVAMSAPLAMAQLNTSTLGTAIDDVNSTFYDYFLVLLAKYWPFVVGVGVLIVVWGFGRRALHAFS